LIIIQDWSFILLKEFCCFQWAHVDGASSRERPKIVENPNFLEKNVASFSEGTYREGLVSQKGHFLQKVNVGRKKANFLQTTFFLLQRAYRSGVTVQRVDISRAIPSRSKDQSLLKNIFSSLMNHIDGATMRRRKD